MVVRGNGRRPVAKQTIIVLQIAGGGIGCSDRITTFVQGIIDCHIPLTGRTGKLPDTGCAELAISFIVKRRFHMGKIGKVFRQAIAFKNPFYLGKICSGTYQTFTKPVLLASLQPDIVMGRPECRLAGMWTKQSRNPFLFR